MFLFRFYSRIRYGIYPGIYPDLVVVCMESGLKVECWEGGLAHRDVLWNIE